MAGSYGRHMFNFLRKLSICFPERLYHFTLPPVVYDGWEFQFPYIFTNTVIFIFDHSGKVVVVVLICISLGVGRVGDLDKGGQKIQTFTCKMNKSWGCNW